jgi:hypothetical protein
VTGIPLGRVARDCLTGPDGRTYAFGRVLGALAFGSDLLAKTVLGLWLLVDGPEASLGEWAAFVGTVSGTLIATAAGVTTLVRLTNGTEPLPADLLRQGAAGLPAGRATTEPTWPAGYPNDAPMPSPADRLGL